MFFNKPKQQSPQAPSSPPSAPLSEEGLIQGMAAAPAGTIIFDVGLDDFEDKVIKASLEKPVLVDFWAPWCGPCKQLTPVLEKAVQEAGGQIALAKINMDENQQLAAMLRIQSVPTVYVFIGGRPADAFQGALPESQIKSFINKAITAFNQAQPDALDIPEALKTAAHALTQNDIGTAQALYSQILQQDQENAQAYAGMVRVFIAARQLDQANAILEQAPENIAKHAAFAEAKTALELAQAAPQGSASDLEATLEKSPEDHQSRFDLAMIYFSQDRQDEAMDQLLTIIRKDREWEDSKARTQLVKFFEALGPSDPLTIQYRQKLSSILFA